MKILALEPFYGGSHKSFLDGWISRSKHQWNLYTLPPYKWKWRMRHSAVSLAEELSKSDNFNYDLIFCSDMLNLAEFIGLAPDEIKSIPKLVYFHENQLTYPKRIDHERDMHFVYTNFTTAITADHIWFNSSYHLEEFTTSLKDFLERMPDYNHSELVELIKSKSIVSYPGIDQIEKIDSNNEIPIILWAARWEYDKNPELFFEAVEYLLSKKLKFKISVIGESFKDSPEIFQIAKEKYQSIIAEFGYLDSYDNYKAVLHKSDIIVSTANHEFFGIAVLEALSAGALPCLPNMLAYPEVLRISEYRNHEQFVYNNKEELFSKLEMMVTNYAMIDKPDFHSFVQQNYSWNILADRYDLLLESYSK